MAKRQTITFDDDLVKQIDDWRAKQRPIPKFQNAVTELVRRGLR